MQLQSQPHRQAIRQESTPSVPARSIPATLPAGSGNTGENNTWRTRSRKPVLRREIPREIIIPAAGNHKLNFVFAADGVEIRQVECVRLRPSLDISRPQS